MDGSGGYHPEWSNPITKEHTWYALTDKWILVRSSEYPRYNLQNTWNSRRRKTKVWILWFLLEVGNKIPKEGVLEIKFGAETEGMTIQQLPHLGIHPINNHQSQTLLQMPTRFCWQEPDMVVSSEVLPVSAKYRSGCSQSPLDGAHGPQWRS